MVAELLLLGCFINSLLIVLTLHFFLIPYSCFLFPASCFLLPYALFRIPVSRSRHDCMKAAHSEWLKVYSSLLMAHSRKSPLCHSGRTLRTPALISDLSGVIPGCRDVDLSISGKNPFLINAPPLAGFNADCICLLPLDAGYDGQEMKIENLSGCDRSNLVNPEESKYEIRMRNQI